MRVFVNFMIFAIFVNSGIADPPDCNQEPSVMQLYTCCDVPFTSKIYEKCKHETIRKALIDIALEEEISRNELVFEMCTAECEFQTKNFLRGVNDIDFEAVRKDLEKCFPHEIDFAQNYIKGLHDCLDYARNRAHKLAMEHNLVCSYFPGLLRKCAFHAAIRNCAPERWHFSEKCNEFKNWLEHCNVLKIN